jgi:hypothetical protein
LARQIARGSKKDQRLFDSAEIPGGLGNHYQPPDARGAPRDATCRGEFVERCRALRQTSEQSDFGSDKQMLRTFGREIA